MRYLVRAFLRARRSFEGGSWTALSVKENHPVAAESGSYAYRKRKPLTSQIATSVTKIRQQLRVVRDLGIVAFGDMA